ncbi:hypothetical protein BC937DRAFT_93862 [Endogone sp. FLAS-F59071]|nr:hypothetical protein BC937DRAFT_93862 [Endogone sp. FLAS-F59071]|eukprot:RUS14422.1 hypothetical protein BC937DRAFT_93862 [Endogone sp. FLAS-F59071]
MAHGRLRRIILHGDFHRHGLVDPQWHRRPPDLPLGAALHRCRVVALLFMLRLHEAARHPARRRLPPDAIDWY